VKTILLLHILAVLLSAVCLWSMRHELTEKATSRAGWALPPALAITAAAILLFVSPGKRFELWTVAILVGLALGLGAGVILKVDKDFERKLVRVQRTWDGVGAAALLFLLALARVVTSDLITRQSGKFGMLGAIAAFLATYLAGRVITMRYYTAPRSIHLDMTKGQRPRTE
jgi:membrane protein CcdC involved in cytochrome C biogenesis